MTKSIIPRLSRLRHTLLTAWHKCDLTLDSWAGWSYMPGYAFRGGQDLTESKGPNQQRVISTGIAVHKLCRRSEARICETNRLTIRKYLHKFGEWQLMFRQWRLARGSDKRARAIGPGKPIQEIGRVALQRRTARHSLSLRKELDKKYE